MKIDRPIIIAFTLFVILILIFFLVMPEYKTFKKLQVNLAEKTAEYNAQFDYYSAIDKTQLDLQSRQEDIKKIDDALPADPTLGRLIYFLQETAKENGIMFKDIFLSKASLGDSGTGVGKSVKDIVFSLNLAGSYASLENFIISLEKSSRVFEVTGISFGAATSSSIKQTQPTQQTFNFSLQIKTHSY